MTTLAESLISSASRPLTVRKRPDLTATRQMYQGTRYRVVKEPVGLQYFRFHEEEYFILQMLDGHVSLQQIKDAFEQRFAPQKITFGDLQQFIGMLHRSGLVISNAPGQGRQLKKRRGTKKRKEVLGKFANIFAIRFRGVDPERVLNRIVPWTGWLFTVPALIFFISVGIAALLLIGTNWQTFQAKLPSFQEFFAAKNWLYMAVMLAVVKVLHEFGHGISCKKFGGECHELGFMLLVFTPCLYCNVSDSWMLPNKWKRVWIGAGGMYVELILASFATFLWWYSEPGLFNFACLAVMFICSVSTVLFNANPLLRFDGYYILMDILEIPNLRQKSTEVLKRWFQETCLGLELQDNPFLPHRNRFLFGMFTVASVIYRWVIVFSIVMFLNQVLKPYGLQIVGRALAVMGFAGLVAQPIWQTYKFIRTPGRLQKVKGPRLAATLGVVATVVALVAFVPLPHHIDCAFEIRPADAHSVYAGTAGQIQKVYVRPGDSVQPGDPIVELVNRDLEMEALDLRSERKVTEVRLTSLEKQYLFSDNASDVISGQIQTQAKLLEAVQDLLESAEEKVEKLVVRAPVAGVIIPPPEKKAEPEEDGRLPSWSGSPLEPENLGASMGESDLICLVGDPIEAEAMLIVDQGDIQLVKEGLEVELKLESHRLDSFSGEIDQISRTELQQVPSHLASQTGGGLDTQMSPEGRLKAISTSYQARVPIPRAGEMDLRVGYRGWAKVHTEWKSLGWRLWRLAIKTFNFEL